VLLWLRKKISVGNVLMIVALVFAMSGAAYAAVRITSINQISPKVRKQLQGKQGPAGAQGPAGPAGSQGSAGPQGPAGPTGPTGAEGPKGATGSEGSPWTVGGKLPSGKTLKGDWVISGHPSGGGLLLGSATDSVSFGLPLAAAPIPAYISPPTKEEEEKHEFPNPPAGCTGNVTNPGAEPGHLCVFARNQINAQGVFVCSTENSLIQCLVGQQGSDPTGSIIAAIAEKEGLMLLGGTWAVTAE
jgi:Collagen triple helix repeat (20 copies)